MVCLVYGHCRRDLTSERCLLRWTRLVSRWSLPARMKKSSCIQLTTPKLVNLNTLSMIHITWVQIIMRRTLQRCRWCICNLVAKADSWRENCHEERHVCGRLECKKQWAIGGLWLQPYLMVGHHQKVLLLELGGSQFHHCHTNMKM